MESMLDTAIIIVGVITIVIVVTVISKIYEWFSSRKNNDENQPRTPRHSVEK